MNKIYKYFSRQTVNCQKQDLPTGLHVTEAHYLSKAHKIAQSDSDESL